MHTPEAHADYRSMVRWRQIQGFLLLTKAVLPVTLFFGLNKNFFLMTWTTLMVCMIGAWLTRLHYRIRVDQHL